MSAPPAPAPFMFDPSGTQSMHWPLPVPIALGATERDWRMLPASSPSVSAVGKLPPLLFQRLEDSSDQLFMTLVLTCMPMPPLPTDRRFFAKMLQPSGLALHGVPSARSSSPTTPPSPTVAKTDTFSSCVSAAPRLNRPTPCARTMTVSFTRLWPSGSTGPLNLRARIVDPYSEFRLIVPRI